MSGRPIIQTFSATPSALVEIRRFVLRAAMDSTLGREQAEELALAASEACTNAIRHTETVELRLAVHLDDGCVVVDVEDQGVFRRSMPVAEVDPGGRGIMMMRAFVDQIAIEEGTPAEPGTRVHLVKCKQG
jgi:anti-sigma regulatory factor (Ser/Thr protein kinase)